MLKPLPVNECLCKGPSYCFFMREPIGLFQCSCETLDDWEGGNMPHETGANK